jgi:hypothetical protein
VVFLSKIFNKGKVSNMAFSTGLPGKIKAKDLGQIIVTGAS